MEMDSIQIRFAVSLVTSFLIAARAFKRKSVDLSGVLTGIPVMVIHMLAGYRFAALLLVFFFTASKLTRVGEERKRNIDAEFKEGGQRNWYSKEYEVLVVIFQLHFDQTVRKGTNGGVTIDGLLAAAAAGCVIGLAFVLVGLLTTECAGDVAWRQFLIIPIASAAGFCGSMMDSLLGATLQFSGYCTLRKKVVGKQGPTVIKISGMNILDNNGVNAVSVLSTTLVTSITCLYVF
ncbi:protein PGR isoform X2 [Elaeis guineensis]|uniref:Protein PGR isoform X2 n=1 Tax=Elaeis guineensis var. tenera TaxID=51953 RepID=A0A8N4IEG0_ELAGV|nr:protein PGR isoform X2 [Elaeis guineensis]